MIDLVGPSNSITMSDVMVTIAAFFAGWTKYAQSAKDQQLADRDKHIAWLEKQLDALRDTVEQLGK